MCLTPWEHYTEHVLLHTWFYSQGSDYNGCEFGTGNVSIRFKHIIACTAYNQSGTHVINSFFGPMNGRIIEIYWIPYYGISTVGQAIDPCIIPAVNHHYLGGDMPYYAIWFNRYAGYNLLRINIVRYFYNPFDILAEFA